jgi:glycine oxidase
MAPSHKNGNADVVVAGGGVIGLACAWSAMRRGLRVVVLERAESTAGATRVAAGMLAPVGELQHGEEVLLEMTVAAAGTYADWAAEVEEASGRGTGYERLGSLHVALDRDEAEELRRQHELQRSVGLEAEWLGPRGCRRLEPGLHPSLNGGVFVEGEAVVDPRLLAEGLRGALEAGGGEVRFGAEVEELMVAGGRAVGVRLAGGEELRADAVVCATGSWSGGGGSWLTEGVRPPVRPVKGEVVELRSRDGERLCERIVASERVYVVPRADGRVILGATMEEAGFDQAVTAGGVLELLREAYRLLPEVAEMEVVEAAAGLRPGTPDNVPIVGRSEIEGLVLATGHHRNGVLLAPLTGEAAADVLEGGEVEGPLRAADPRRFAVGPTLFSDQPAGVAR